MDKIVIILIVIIAIIILIVIIKNSSSSNNTKIKQQVKNQVTQPKLTSKQEFLVEFLGKWFPGMDEKVINTTVTKWGNGPNFTFPIEGICKDGELVSDVLKRLEIEGNLGKILYFKKYMGIEY